MTGRARIAALCGIVTGAALAAWLLAPATRGVPAGPSRAKSPSSEAPPAEAPRAVLSPAPRPTSAPAGEDARGAPGRSEPGMPRRSSASTQVEDEDGRPIPGVRVFLDLDDSMMRTREARLLDPGELAALEQANPHALADWARTTDASGTVAWGLVESAAALRSRAVILSVPGAREDSSCALPWTFGRTRIEETYAPEPSRRDIWTLGVRRRVGVFRVRAGGDRPLWWRLRRKAGGDRSVPGDEAEPRTQWLAPGAAESTGVLEGFCGAGSYALRLVAPDGHALAAEFDVVEGETVRVTSPLDLGGRSVRGILSGIAARDCRRIAVHVSDLADPGAPSLGVFTIGLSIDPGGEFRVPLPTGSRRVLFSFFLDDLRRRGGDADPVWVVGPSTFDAPFPESFRIDSAVSARIVVRVLDRGAHPVPEAVVRATPKGEAGSDPERETLRTGLTSEDGRFESFPGFPGLWSVQVWPPDSDVRAIPATVEVEASVGEGRIEEVVVRLP